MFTHTAKARITAAPLTNNSSQLEHGNFHGRTIRDIFIEFFILWKFHTHIQIYLDPMPPATPSFKSPHISFQTWSPHPPLLHNLMSPINNTVHLSMWSPLLRHEQPISCHSPKHCDSSTTSSRQQLRAPLLEPRLSESFLPHLSQPCLKQTF